MRFLFSIGIFLCFCGCLLAQKAMNREELFEEGDYFFNREDYAEASFYFRNLVNNDSLNCHFNFKLGECYMNMPGSESLAVKCFERATKHVTEKNKYKARSIDEKNAPLHVWFYLGNVYRIVGRLGDALEAYDVFVNSPLYYGNYNLTVVENEIKSCERAKIIMDSPIDVTIQLLDTSINTTAAEFNPVITPDEKYMVFVRRLKFYDAVLIVEKKGNSWSLPVNLNPLIGSDGDFYPVSLSKDGKILLLVRDANENKDIYVSYFRDNTWTKAEPLPGHVNSPADETWACLSADGNKLWFTSTRTGGQGGSDIYYAVRESNGQWGKVRNAGKTINTMFDEESPFVCCDDKILYFSSKGHYSMGGYDIFYTRMDDRNWKEPVNIGYPVNNTQDNIGFVPLFDGHSGYMQIFSKSTDNISNEDIIRVSIHSIFPLP